MARFYQQYKGLKTKERYDLEAKIYDENELIVDERYPILYPQTDVQKNQKNSVRDEEKKNYLRAIRNFRKQVNRLNDNWKHCGEKSRHFSLTCRAEIVIFDHQNNEQQIKYCPADDCLKCKFEMNEVLFEI